MFSADRTAAMASKSTVESRKMVEDGLRLAITQRARSNGNSTHWRARKRASLGLPRSLVGNRGEGDVKGALVTAVTTGCPRKRRELSWEMAIEEAGDKRVGTAQAVAKSIEAASATGSISLSVVNSKGEGCDVSVPIPNTAPVSPGPKQGCGQHRG